MVKVILFKIFLYGYVLPSVIMLAIFVWHLWKYTRKCTYINYWFEAKRMLWSFVPVLNIFIVLFYFLDVWSDYMAKRKQSKQ
jgi:hypothetical protein